MPYGIRARGRKRRSLYQEAGQDNRVANAMDPGVRALRPARTKSRIRGARNIAKGQHTAQAYQIGQAQAARDEQERQNAFSRQMAEKNMQRQVSRDKESDLRFRLLRGDRLKTDDERKAEMAKRELAKIEATLGRPQVGRVAGRMPSRSAAPKTRTPSPAAAKPGELPKQPSKMKDYWISALEKFNPEAAKKLREVHPQYVKVETPQEQYRHFLGLRIPGTTKSVAPKVEEFENPQAGKLKNEDMQRTYLDALDEFARRNPQGTEEDAVRFAAKAAGLKLPSKSEQAAGIKELFSPTGTKEERRQAKRKAAGRIGGKAKIRPRRSLSAVPAATQASAGVGAPMAPAAAPAGQAGTTPTLGPQAPIARSSGGGAPFPGGKEPQWYKDRVADKQEDALFGPKRTIAPRPFQRPIIGIGAPVAYQPNVEAPAPTPAVAGSAGYEDVVNAATGITPAGALRRGVNLVSGGTQATERGAAIRTLSLAQEKLRSGAVPQEQREPLQRMLLAVNNLMGKENRTPEEETLLNQAIERLNALYGG